MASEACPARDVRSRFDGTVERATTGSATISDADPVCDMWRAGGLLGGLGALLAFGAVGGHVTGEEGAAGGVAAVPVDVSVRCCV